MSAPSAVDRDVVAASPRPRRPWPTSATPSGPMTRGVDVHLDAIDEPAVPERALNGRAALEHHRGDAGIARGAQRRLLERRAVGRDGSSTRAGPRQASRALRDRATRRLLRHDYHRPDSSVESTRAAVGVRRRRSRITRTSGRRRKALARGQQRIVLRAACRTRSRSHRPRPDRDGYAGRPPRRSAGSARPPASATLPSALSATFIVTCGRPRRIRVRNGAFSRRASASSMPTVTSTPWARRIPMPRPLTSGFGSSIASTARRMPAADDQRRAGPGAPRVAAGLERAIERRARARSPASASAMTSACGPPATGVRPASDHDAFVVHDDRADHRVRARVPRPRSASASARDM